MPRSPAPTIEQRILAALRRHGTQTISQLHGPGTPGLTGRRASEIAAACEAMIGRRELAVARGYDRVGRSVLFYSLPPGWTDTPAKEGSNHVAKTTTAETHPGDGRPGRRADTAAARPRTPDGTE